MSLAQQGTQVALRGLNKLAGLDLIDRAGLRGLTERLVFRGTRGGFRAANAAGRTFASVQKLTQPARQPRAKSSGSFDLTPTEEQQMMQEAVGDFASGAVTASGGNKNGADVHGHGMVRGKVATA